MRLGGLCSLFWFLLWRCKNCSSLAFMDFFFVVVCFIALRLGEGLFFTFPLLAIVGWIIL